MSEPIYGLVLWADALDGKGVVWCEDQGDLAFYNGETQSMHDGQSVDAGDLVELEARQDTDCRRVNKMRLVGAGYAPNLAQDLRGCMAQQAASRHETPGSNVIAFPGSGR